MTSSGFPLPFCDIADLLEKSGRRSFDSIAEARGEECIQYMKKAQSMRANRLKRLERGFDPYKSYDS